LNDPISIGTAAAQAVRKFIPQLPEDAVADAPPANAEDTGQEEALSLGRGLSSRDLKKEADEAEHDRSERFRNHFEWLATKFLYGGAVALALIAGVWLWHTITPWHFLTADQLSHIQSLLTGGVLVSVGTNYMKRRLGE
jgi:hypothetical protein